MTCSHWRCHIAATNRARGAHRQIAADTDLEAVRLWLAEYANSPHTLRSYRKEAVRLLVWTARVLGKALSSLTREDFLLYERFLAAPTADWTDPALPRRGGARRLFDGPLAEHSQRQALGILSGLFNYLVAAGYLAGNPLALRRARGTRASRTRRVERYLDHALWQLILDSVETWSQATARERQHYERSRWVVRLLYHDPLVAPLGGFAPGRRRHRHPIHPEEPAARLDRDDGPLSACGGRSAPRAYVGEQPTKTPASALPQ